MNIVRSLPIDRRLGRLGRLGGDQSRFGRYGEVKILDTTGFELQLLGRTVRSQTNFLIKQDVRK
jgi:hypothetical protein